MKISYNWLQDYFDEQLPKPDELAEVLTMQAYEVESIENSPAGGGNDTVLDIDILPNRASDSLCHAGVAREVSVLCGIPLKEKEVKKEKGKKTSLKISVQDFSACPRYMGRVIRGVKVEESPQWLKERLLAIGQKPVNAVVDAANYIMFDTGQPLHVFDLNNISGCTVSVRDAQRSEKLTTLDDETVTLSNDDLVIADTQKAVAIAGVKGGKDAEVSKKTTDIVLESANFNPTRVRKTARSHNLLTDASKRFENGITPHLAGEAIHKLTTLILELSDGEPEEIVDVHDKLPRGYKIGVSTDEVNRLLGTDLKNKDIESILEKLNFPYEKIERPIEKVLELAPKFVGKEYIPVGTVIYDAPEKFSCSSFTNYLFIEGGIALPSLSIDQYVYGEKIDEKDIQQGDLVFSNTGEGKIRYESVNFLPGTKVPEGVDHCGLYLGDGRVLHSTRYEKKVVIEDLKKSKQFQNIVGYRRIPHADSLRYVIEIPYERLDLRIKEDVIEEIGRVYGYDNIEPAVPRIERKPEVNKTFYYTNKIRDILVSEGFSEVYTYTFQNKGEVKVANPLAEDKRFLRKDLTEGMKSTLEDNAHNAPLLGTSQIKMFELGTVFGKGKEEYHLAVGIYNLGSGTKEDIISVLGEELKTNLPKADIVMKKGDKHVWEIDFGEMVKNIPEPSSYDDIHFESKEVVFEPFSQYPFVLRDIAVWTPKGTKEEEVLSTVEKHAGKLLVQKKLFDEYEKDGKVSYAFNLVFQSNEKTLTDKEVNNLMEKITDELNSKEGFEVR